MVRTQIQLTEAQAVRLKRLAAERGESQAALIRRAVDGMLAGDSLAARHARALEVVGAHGSGVSHVSRDHDDELADAFRG